MESIIDTFTGIQSHPEIPTTDGFEVDPADIVAYKDMGFGYRVTLANGTRRFVSYDDM